MAHGMRILFAAARPAFPFFLGGAEVSIHEALQAFAATGDQCLSLGQVSEGPTDLRAWAGPHELELRTAGDFDLRQAMRLEVVSDVGYPVVNNLLGDLQRRLSDHFDAFKPDIVFSQLDRSEAVLLQAQKRGARAVHFLRDANNPHNFTPYSCAALDGASFITICSSRYLEAYVSQRWGVRAEVLHPPIDCDRFACAAKNATSSRQQVIMVNPVESKGGRIVRYLVEQLPKVKFTLVEGWQALSRAEWPQANVTLVPRRHDLERVFATAALLIVPSQLPEAFGRVVPEAQAAGVPVLASGHSGLIESHGGDDGLVADYADSEVWLSEVKDVLCNTARREALQEAGLTSCRRFERAGFATALRQMVAS
jgi:glycosyltransferase involved in cell wall biosynthesis